MPDLAHKIRRPELLCLLALLTPFGVLAESTFTHVHMRAADMDEVAAWHAELFGGEIRAGGPGPNITHVNGNVGLMSIDIEGGSPDGISVLDHFAVTVTDVEATIAQAVDMGAEIIMEPRQLGTTAFASIADPWGAKIELVEDASYPGINHVHLFSTDPEALKDWFLEVLGGEFVPERGNGRFFSILYTDFWVQISPSRDGQRAPSRGKVIDHFGFGVDSLDEFLPKLEASGYEPYLIRQTPSGSSLVFFEGPEGIHFEIAGTLTTPGE